MNSKILNKIKNNKKDIKLITIDGITCSGKSELSKIIFRKLKKKYKDVFILSKDLFLLSRHQRMSITRNIYNFHSNQNELHYDLKKLNILLTFLVNSKNKRTIKLKNLYNRKNGKNDLTVLFKFKSKQLIIFEGIYINQDIKGLIKPVIKILIIETVYNALSRKIERIRDKKISIQDVVKEYIKIHLFSFKNYLKKMTYDFNFLFQNQQFVKIGNGKSRQIMLIKKFLQKHSF